MKKLVASIISLIISVSDLYADRKIVDLLLNQDPFREHDSDVTRLKKNGVYPLLQYTGDKSIVLVGGSPTHCGN